MRIDLHTHSDRSDGTLSPSQVVTAARQAGLDVVALTDHDSFAGLLEATAAAESVGIVLVPGVEISCRFEAQGVHLLGYRADPAHAGLNRELAKIIDGRNSRLPATLQRLRELGFDIDIADVRAAAGRAVAMGRPHVADAMVAKGFVVNRDEAFARYLGPGGPAYVDRYAADLETMIDLIADAGGVSVIAHPWAGRHDTSSLDRAGFERLRQRGLAGIEADHQDHDAAKRTELHAIAADLGLVATGSSDFHGAGKIGFDLGCALTEPEQYVRLLEGVAG